MGSEMIGALGLGALLILMILRVPVALTMLVVGVVGFAQVISWDAAISQLKTVPVEVLSNYSFSAVPMFILMGVLAAHSGMAGKLFGIDLLAEAPGSAELLARLNERDSAKSVAAERDLAMEKFLKDARGGK